MSDLTVACVLRSGGWCGPEDVQRLAAGVARHLPTQHRFVCLTDVGVPGIETIPLRTRWTGWWAKLELFTPGLFGGRVLYLDLDTVVVGDLSEIASCAAPFAALASFYEPAAADSGVLTWEAEADFALEVWQEFSARPARWTKRYYGDGQFVSAILGGRAERLQDLFPGQIVSFKRDCHGGVPAGARLVCFHGRPRPAELPETHPLAIAWRAPCAS